MSFSFSLINLLVFSICVGKPLAFSLTGLVFVVLNGFASQFSLNPKREKPGRRDSRVGSVGFGFVTCLVSFSLGSSFVFLEVRFDSVHASFRSVDVILGSVEVPER